MCDAAAMASSFFCMTIRWSERLASPEAEELTLQQLSNLNLRDRDGGGTNRMTDEKLPSLKDVFDLTRGRIFLHLDVKRRDMIPGVIACARAMGVDRQVDFWSDLKTSDDLAWIQSNVSPEMVLLMAKTRLGSVDAESQLDLLRQPAAAL